MLKERLKKSEACQHEEAVLIRLTVVRPLCIILIPCDRFY